MFAQPWILLSQMHTSIMAKCVETYLIHIGGGKCLNWLCWTRAHRSSDQCTEMYYENITTEWEGKLYCGITMKWNYTKRYVDISMTRYVKESLHQFGHNTTIKPQHQPYPAPERTYGADAQKTKPLDTSQELPTERVKKIEK